MDAYRPMMASLFFISGKVHRILGEDEVAEQMFRQCVLGIDRQTTDQPQNAVALRATGAEAAYQLSLLRFDRHDYRDALEQATIAVKAEPQSSLYHTALGSALTQLRRTEEAKKELGIALRLDPRNARAAGLLRLLSK